MTRKRFIVISRSPSVADQNALTGFLKGKSWAFWHWMNNCWLVSTRTDLTVHELSGEIRAVAPSMHFVVFEVKDEQKAGFGPKKWWLWFKSAWE